MPGTVLSQTTTTSTDGFLPVSLVPPGSYLIEINSGEFCSGEGQRNHVVRPARQFRLAMRLDRERTGSDRSDSQAPLGRWLLQIVAAN